MIIFNCFKSDQKFYHSFNFGCLTHPGEPDKIITSMKPVFCGAPGLEGAPKDHKTGWDAAVGPPTRGLVNGNVGPNAATGNKNKKYSVKK